MRNISIVSVLLIFMTVRSLPVKAVEGDIADSVKVHFPQNISVLDTALFNNGENLSSFLQKTEITQKNSDFTLRKINIFGAASPEGAVILNRNLSERRARSIYDYLSARIELPDSLVSLRVVGRDWKGLLKSVESDPDVPDRIEVLTLLEDIVSSSTPSTEGDSKAIADLQKIGDGSPYRYLYTRLYPALRESGVEFRYSYSPNYSYYFPDTDVVIPEVEFENLMIQSNVKSCKPFYMALKTNLLNDALALPNIGVEFYLGKNISIGANWLYGWWDKDRRHRYWRAYGGDLSVRWWFGRKAHEKPLTGHHLGVYGGIITYDFEFGGKGWMGGRPHHTLWDRSNRFVGIEYGYSLPVAHRINIDFTVGVGYFGGKYIKYIPKNNHYEWQSTNNLTWFGPTKAEISLVWLIGCDNYNRKGGSK